MTPVTTEVSPVAAHERPPATRKVRATNVGYYDRLRQPGEEFLIPAPYDAVRENGDPVKVDLFSKKWMEDADAPAKKRAKKSAKSAPTARRGAAAKSAHKPAAKPTGDKDPLGAGD